MTKNILAHPTDTVDLAIFSGRARFAKPLHVGGPNIGSREVIGGRLEEILNRRWLTNNGPVVQEFEARLKEYIGVRHCIPICNATIGLELVTRALEMKGEVIVPSFTFVATAHSLQWQEITPVFCDVDPATHCLDPARVEELITPRTTGIVGVHLWGQGAAVDELTEIARRRNLRLVFDAAHAFACSHNGKMIGNFGDAEVFSFHATKFLNSFEGGAIATNDDALAAKVRLMLNFGFSGVDRVTYIGTNGKMTEICAAMGLTSLECVDEFIDRNRSNHAQYSAELNEIPGLRVLSYDGAERQNYQYVVVEVDELSAGLTRDELVRVLTAENVFARRYFYPGCHRMEPYRTLFPHAGDVLPVTESLTTRVFLLPNGTTIGAEEIRETAAILRTSVNFADAVRVQLALQS